VAKPARPIVRIECRGGARLEHQRIVSFSAPVGRRAAAGGGAIAALTCLVDRTPRPSTVPTVKRSPTITNLLDAVGDALGID
jgi:hypothetical protein